MKLGAVKLIMGAVVCLTLSVQAIPITGDIGFTGGATLNDTLANAIAITGYVGPNGSGTSPVVLGGSQSGSYAGVAANTVASWTTFAFNPAPAAITPLWSFTLSGITYSFDSTSLSIISQNALFLDIEGTGIAHITNLDDTAGTWRLTITGGTSVFTFGSSVNIPETGNETPVADGGSTLVLLGLALAGFALVRRSACWC